MGLLREGNKVGIFRIQNLIIENQYCECYRIVDENDNPYFLKLYILKKCPSKVIGNDGIVNEILYSRLLKHKNIVSYISDGTLSLDEGDCQYLVTSYLSGEMLSDKIKREGRLSQDESLELFDGIIDGLEYMHSQSPMLLHNDITPRNIMLADSTGGKPEIIDNGHVSGRCSGKSPFDRADLSVKYSANETFIGIFDEESDIFSAVAVLYTMLVGHAPWNIEFEPSLGRAERIEAIKKKRTEPLDFDDVEIEESLRNVILRGLSVSSVERYHRISELRRALESKLETAPQKKKEPESDVLQKSKKPHTQHQDDIKIQKGRGNGFADIAGMQQLKDMLSQKVIFVMQNKELAEEYKLTPPNGMLLYGPPGCGKTFFAEKFAEETQFNFMLVKSSDVSSTYLHGTQEKIAELFRKAEQNAPTVICFDEFDALVPARDGNSNNQHYALEVNEFLSQLNNCSHRGIFVIATSNRPDKIDPAVLRTGRIDKQVFVPLPDKEARRDMFKMYLKDRPCEESLDYEEMAKLSEGYVASDIAYVVNDVAMVAAFAHVKISQKILEDAIKAIKPSLREDVVCFYDKLKEMMDGVDRKNVRPRIGFIQ